MMPQLPDRAHLFLGLLTCWSVWLSASGIQAKTLPVIHHSFQVAIDPDRHFLKATDRLLIPRTLIESQHFIFHLNSHLTPTGLRVDGRERPLSSLLTSRPTESQEHLTTDQTLTLTLLPEDSLKDPLRITLDFEGPINDPPRSSDTLRFVRPDETNGHIGPEGIYLSSETFWYPTWENILHTFDLTLTLPIGWEAVTQGKPTNRAQGDGTHRTSWHNLGPSEALTLAANRFIVQTRQWHNIELATYLFADEAPLAPQYLDATQQYLQLYTQLLGPFPFFTFAVAENFFPSGLGMPAFTLLGQGVMRRGYTQPYSLGHEIVHSWFGNSVFNDFSQGNWVEGLTTYLANYYYDEATGNITDAFSTRRRMHFEYNLYTSPLHDYPVNQFHHKETRQDNAVGYQKTAFVFHMLRQEIGDRFFFRGVQELIREGTGQYLEWPDLNRVFSQVAGKNLDWFFKQWVSRPGAPRIDWHDLTIQEDPQQPGTFFITGTLTQQEPAYRVNIPVRVELERGDFQTSTVTMAQTSHPIKLTVPARPNNLQIDPQYHVLRRLQRDQLPPMLNMWETDTSRTVFFPQGPLPEEESAYASLKTRVQHQPALHVRTTESPDFSRPGSYLLVGSLAQEAVNTRAFDGCRDRVRVSSEKVTIQDHSYDSQDTAFLISCPHPDHPGHVLSFFFGLSPEAMIPISRLLFFYGWDSYLVFQQGQVVARGMFEPVHSAHSMEFHSP